MLSGLVGVDRGALTKLDIPTLGWDLKQYNRIYLLGLTNLTIIRTNEHGCMRYRGRYQTNQKKKNPMSAHVSSMV